MGFTVWVYSAGRREFGATLPDAIEVRQLRVLIEGLPTAKSMGFAAGDWGVWLADGSGAKIGEELLGSAGVQPAAGASAVNVWVERIAPPAAIGAAGELPWVRVHWVDRGSSHELAASPARFSLWSGSLAASSSPAPQICREQSRTPYDLQAGRARLRAARAVSSPRGGGRVASPVPDRVSWLAHSHPGVACRLLICRLCGGGAEQRGS